MDYTEHTEVRVKVDAAAADLFAMLDDQEALGAHMMERSTMMAGGRMGYQFDDAKGRVVGSVIRMQGAMLGLSLSIEEVVTERVPPLRKVLETRGAQKMVVMEAYRLGFEIEPRASQSALRVFIDYNLPPGIGGLMSALPAYFYARWCVTSMAGAAVERFGSIGNLQRTERRDG